MDAVFDNALAKVDEYAELERCQSQVRQDLSLEDAIVGCDGFAFDDDFSARNQVDSKRGGKCSAFVGDWEPYLPLYGKTPLRQFPNQGLFIDAFEEARPPQGAMDFNGAPDNVAADLVFV